MPNSHNEEKYIEGRLDLNRYLIKHPVATFYVRISGDSMINAGIYPGSILVVDRVVEAINGDIVIARLNDELMVKRLRIIGDTVWLMPENSAFIPIKVDEGADFEVWGRVMHIIRSLPVDGEVFHADKRSDLDSNDVNPASENVRMDDQFYSCFISYSHADRPFARHLYDALHGRGIQCWLDEHQLLPGQKIDKEIDRSIRLWDKVLLCCSKNSLTSWWVENEIQIAFDKEQKLWKERGVETLVLVPLDMDGFLFKQECQSGLATQIRSRLAADFIDWEHEHNKFEKQVELLVRALRANSKEAIPKSKL
jgi:DNA polymerase V